MGRIIKITTLIVTISIILSIAVALLGNAVEVLWAQGQSVMNIASILFLSLSVYLNMALMGYIIGNRV